VQRGLVTPDAARAFLRPEYGQRSDPYAIAGVREAVACIAAVVRGGGHILVHGDYDVDGQCATAVLTRALRLAGAQVTPFIPDRMRDGYDLGSAGLAEAQRIGAALILTCDCGITALDAVARARAAGRSVIVTDHHLPGAVLPDADAVIDPHQASDTSGLTMLCGSGLALKLVEALVEPLGLPAALPQHLLDYVAIATVADVVPLVGENRALVRHGLRVLAATRWPGLAALLATCHLGGGPVRAAQVAFILGPRLNAAGRIGDPRDGLELLLTDNDDIAAARAAGLDALNRRRQELDQRTLEQALDLLTRQYGNAEDHAAFVLAADEWHPGVVGIVASRVVERFGRPALLIGFDGDIGRGSGRSVDGFDLHAALVECGEWLERFGGHRMAAGLTIRRDRLDAFRRSFGEVARARLATAELGPTQRVDLEVALGDVSDDLERLGRHLEPCGMGNPAPIFGVRGATMVDVRTVGKGHLKGRLAAGGHCLDAIAFGWADRAPADLSAPLDVAFRLERNAWQGTDVLQARIVSLVPAAAA
jgi:single-stranded-DNA-specific exonuclease